jgi:hypothetical protein
MTRGATARKTRQEEAAAAPVAFLLPRDMAQSFLNYLTSRPYGEVHQLVQALTSLTGLDQEQLDGLAADEE